MAMRFNTRTSILLALLCVLVVAAVMIALPAWAEDEEDWLLEEEWFDEDWEALNEELMQSFAADDEIYFDPVQIAGGFQFTVALYRDGTVWGWGMNSNGYLGDGTRQSSMVPVQVIGLSNIEQIAVGSNHTLALGEDGTVWAWGAGTYGQLGNNKTQNSSVPVRVSGLQNIIKVGAGASLSVALDRDGFLWTWGLNQNGALGDGTTSNRALAEIILSDVEDIFVGSTGSQICVAKKSDGSYWCWGLNSNGNLGNGTIDNVLTPQLAQQFDGAVQILSSSYSTLFLKEDGTVWGCGQNLLGQLTDYSTTIINPVQLGLENVKQIALNESAAYALLEDGTVWSWGSSTYGALGYEYRGGLNKTPTQIEELSNVVRIGSCHYNAYVIKEDGTAWAWGYNEYSQLGDYTKTKRITPVLMFPSRTSPTDPTRIWIELAVGETVDLRATALPSELEISPAIWSSADPDIASVNSNGVVTGMAEGMTFVTVTTVDGQYSASIGILVHGEVENIEGMRLEIKLSVGMKTKLIATNANDEVTTDVIWTSSLPNVATVDADGRIEGISSGVTIITATTLGGDFVDSVYVRVL